MLHICFLDPVSRVRAANIVRRPCSHVTAPNKLSFYYYYYYYYYCFYATGAALKYNKKVSKNTYTRKDTKNIKMHLLRRYCIA